MSFAIQTIIIIIANIVAILLTKYLTTYSSEKGKNQATKEDLAELTKIAESIKSELSQKTEELKAQLNLLNQHKLSLKSAERDALLAYGDSVCAWVASLHRCDAGRFTKENFHEVTAAIEKLRERELQFDLASGRLELYMHDAEFLNTRRDFTIAMIEFETYVVTALLNIKHIYSQGMLRLEACQLKYPTKTLESITQYHELEMQLSAEVHETVKRQKSGLSAEFGKVHRAQVPVVTLIHSRLTVIQG